MRGNPLYNNKKDPLSVNDAKLLRAKGPAKVAERSELEPWHSEVEERPWFVQRTGALLVASASGPSLDVLQASAIGCCQETQEVLEPSLHLLRPPTFWRHCRMQKKEVFLLCLNYF